MALQPQSVIETERLLLRPMQADDVDTLLSVFISFTNPPFTRGQMEQWTQRNLGHQNQYGYGLFSIILKSEGRLIGDCGLEWMELEGTSVAELGYDLRSDYWNQGYATEAATAVRDFAFRTLRLPQIISLIRVGNLSSRRVAEKNGMQLQCEFMRYDQPYWKYIINHDLWETNRGQNNDQRTN